MGPGQLVALARGVRMSQAFRNSTQSFSKAVSFPPQQTFVARHTYALERFRLCGRSSFTYPLKMQTCQHFLRS